MNLRDLPPPGELALIGVSGGRDSVALLHALRARGFEKLVVCHLDHGLRAESAEDARFVAGLAEEQGCEVVIARQDVAARARRRRQSLETAGREARYGLFAQVARNRGCPRLFLGHHADDQVETFLFNLFRGSAVSGLAGMRPVSRQVIGGVALEICRPLLAVWREEIDAYIARHQLAFREDASNVDSRHTRNRLRHEIIPAITRALERDIRRPVWRAAEILRAEDEFLAGLSAGQTVSSQLLPSQLLTADLSAQPLALQRRLLHAWLKSHAVPDVGYEEVEAVRALLTCRAAKTNLPGGWHARRRARQLFLEPPSSGSTSAPA